MEEVNNYPFEYWKYNIRTNKTKQKIKIDPATLNICFKNRKEKEMTNRQWLIWQLIDMSDEEFARMLNGHGLGWFCDICTIYDCNDYNGCEKEFIKWLQKDVNNEI